MVTNGRWGLYVNPTRKDQRPQENRLVLRPASLQQQARNAAALAMDLQNTQRRMRSISRSPLRRRTKGPMQYARAKSGIRQAESPKHAPTHFRSASPSPGPCSRPARRWWADLLEEEEEETRKVYLCSGAELRIMDAADVAAGVTIEYSLATDMEEGPGELDPASDRVFIISKKV